LIVRSASIVAVVTFAGEDENRVARFREPQRALRDGIAHATNHLRFPSGPWPKSLFPIRASCATLMLAMAWPDVG